MVFGEMFNRESFHLGNFPSRKWLSGSRIFAPFEWGNFSKEVIGFYLGCSGETLLWKWYLGKRLIGKLSFVKMAFGRIIFRENGFG